MIATEKIIERRGALGGRVLFCDTGAGKGGRLSWIDLPKDAYVALDSVADVNLLSQGG